MVSSVYIKMFSYVSIDGKQTEIFQSEFFSHYFCNSHQEMRFFISMEPIKASVFNVTMQIFDSTENHAHTDWTSVSIICF